MVVSREPKYDVRATCSEFTILLAAQSFDLWFTIPALYAKTAQIAGQLQQLHASWCTAGGTALHVVGNWLGQTKTVPGTAGLKANRSTDDFDAPHACPSVYSLEDGDTATIHSAAGVSASHNNHNGNKQHICPSV